MKLNKPLSNDASFGSALIALGNIFKMVKKLLSLKEISEHYDTYYFDQWGVVHDGINIFNEAEQVFSYLQSLNKKIYIISNSGKKSSDNTNRLIKWVQKIF